MQAGKYMSRTSSVFVLEASQAAFNVFIEDKKQAEKSNFLVTSYIPYTHRAVIVSAALSRKEYEN